jgi:putative selenium metabolism protein SsnA
MSIVIRNATLVQFDPPTVQLGQLKIENGTITAVGPHVDVRGATELIDCRGSVVTPGLVNGHTHLYSALAVGMPAPEKTPRDFHEILKFIWWRLDRAHDRESIRASGQIGALAALRCGTTTLIDHHSSPNSLEGSLDTLRDGIHEVGCRGVLCYETTDRNGVGEAVAGLAENERFIERCQKEQDGCFAGMVGAHASFTMSDEALAGCVDLANRKNIGVHIHVAEDPVDERLTKQIYGIGLLDRFKKHGLLDVAGTIFAHGTHLAPADITIINECSNIHLAHNPSSNMNNSVGYAPVAEFSEPPLLGTDGIGADMWREAKTALFKSNDSRQKIGYDHILRMLHKSARHASDSLGIELGELKEGSAADIVLTNYRPATPIGADNLASHLIYALGAQYVRDVMIGGKWCLRGGEVVSCDAARITTAASTVASQLHRQLAKTP